jgi:hypothetical protein
MATNKLMEAAAEILAGSKKSAPAMSPEKLAGEVQDLGGPTPQNSKPDDDSNKIHVQKDKDTSGQNQASIKTKPSDASPDTQEMLGGGKKTMKEDEVSSKAVIAEKEHDEEEDEEEDKEEMKKKMKEDVDALFSDDSTISESFKAKVATIFEARVHDRVAQIEEQVEAKYASMFEEAVASIKSDLTEKVDDYLNYVVEQWMADNEIAIESGLRAELTEDFIAGLRNLFAEHYIDVPAEKVDLVDELAGKVEELESKLNEEIERGIEYKKALTEAVKLEITREVCAGLTDTQAEKVKSLAESVDFSTADEYKEKLETIRENYFPSGVKKADETQLHEQVEEASEQKEIADPFVAAVSKAISKTIK